MWWRAGGTHPGSLPGTGQCRGAGIRVKQRPQTLPSPPPCRVPYASSPGTSGGLSTATSTSRGRPGSATLATQEPHRHIPLHSRSRAVRDSWGAPGSPWHPGAHLGTRGSGGTRQARWKALGQPSQQMSSPPSPQAAHSSSFSCAGGTGRGSPPPPPPGGTDGQPAPVAVHAGRGPHHPTSAPPNTLTPSLAGGCSLVTPISCAPGCLCSAKGSCWGRPGSPGTSRGADMAGLTWWGAGSWLCTAGAGSRPWGCTRGSPLCGQERGLGQPGAGGHPQAVAVLPGRDNPCCKRRG